MTSFALAGVKDSPTGPTRTDGGGFQYYDDGALKFAADNRSAALYSSIHDRAYSYDHVGRLKTALSGAEARAFVGGTGPSATGPYSHAFSYDAWGNRTGQSWRYWSEENSSSDPYDPATGRHAAPWEYDADGRLVSKNEESPSELPFVPARYSYDASGRLFRKTQTTSRQIIAGGATITTAVTTVDTFDGDGIGVKRDTIRKINANQPTTQTTYYLRSTVLGGRVITEYNTSGVRKTSYAWAGGEVLAQQSGADGSSPRLKWQHINPVTGDGRETDANGTLLTATYLDPDGVNIGVIDPFALAAGDPTLRAESPINSRVAQIIASYEDMNCTIDGILSSCRMAHSLLASGAAEQCPQNNCGPRTVTATFGGRSYNTLSSPFSAYADGRSGFMTGGVLLPDGFSMTLTGDRAADAAAAFELALLSPGGVRYGFELVLSAYGPGGFAWYELQGDNARSGGGLSQQNNNGNRFDTCFGKYVGGRNLDSFDKYAAEEALDVADYNPDKAAMISAFWGRESAFQFNPTGDHGPAQLTSWWKNNHGNLIVPGSFDTFSRPAGHPNRDRPFQGNVRANLQSLSNIIDFSLDRYKGSLYESAYHYGPGDPKDKTGYNPTSRKYRAAYGKDVVNNYNILKPFFECYTLRRDY